MTQDPAVMALTKIVGYILLIAGSYIGYGIQVADWVDSHKISEKSGVLLMLAPVILLGLYWVLNT